MPFIIYIFSLCAFAIGFTEFITIGLTSVMATDLHTDVANIGFAVTTYALGAVIGAPILTALAWRWTRRRLILTAMLMFTLSSLLAAFSGSLGLLLVARLISGLAHGVFLAVAASVATRLVHPSKAGSAMALVFGGITIAMSLGVPLGTWIGTILRWQLVFLVIAFCSILGTLGIYFRMPSNDKPKIDDGSRRLNKLFILFNPWLLVGAIVPMLSFALYTFISPILINITNLSVAMASGLLLCYGVGAAVGNIAAGRLIDQRGMDQISVLMVSGVSLTLLLSAFFLSSPVAMGLVIGILGFATYGAIPPLQSRMLMLAQRYVPDAIDIASGMNIAAFNTGVAAGSVLGGASARYGGLSILPWISAGISILALTALFLQIKSKSMRAINKKILKFY